MPFLSEFLRVIFAGCAEFVRKKCGTDAICSGKRAFFEHFSALGNCEIQNFLGEKHEEIKKEPRNLSVSRFLARLKRFELLTFWSVARRSIQLS